MGDSLGRLERRETRGRCGNLEPDGSGGISMVLDSGRVSVALEGFLEGGSEEGAGRDLACQGAEAGRGASV